MLKDKSNRLPVYLCGCLLMVSLMLLPVANTFADEKQGRTKDVEKAKPVKQNRSEGPKLENDLFSLRLFLQTPEQMAAFYEGRGFSKAARDLIRQTCYVTAIFRNKSQQVIWLDLKDWRFFSDGREVKRLDRDYWSAQWNSINLEQASRSTFGWTLLPEVRDIQPNESVGGNLVLPSLYTPFTLKAYFALGQNRRGTGVKVQFNNIKCAKDE